MNRLLAAILLALAPFGALAQTVTDPAQIALVCAFNTSPPAPTSGQYYFVQCDNTGKLITTGSAATPGGSSLTLQYNNAGSFGGLSGSSWDDTNRSLTLTGATVTTSNPVLNLSQTWNAGGVTFTGLKFNATSTASAAGSLLLDLQLAGTSQFSVNKAGGVVLGANGTVTFPTSSVAAPGNPGIGNWAGTLGLFGASGALAATISGSVFNIGVTFQLNGNTHITSPADGIVLLQNNANADFGRLQFGGTTASFPALKRFGNAPAVRAADDTVPTFSTLTACASGGEGAVAPISDSTTNTWGATITGSGANHVLAYCDGTNWTVAAK